MVALPDIMFENEFLDDVVGLMDQEALNQTAQLIKLNIPGFSKRWNNIPKAILIANLKRRLTMVKNSNIFYNSIILLYKDGYKDLSKEEFIIKLENDNIIRPPLKLVLITYYYPKMYEENRDSLIANLRGNKTQISDLIIADDPAKKLELLANLSITDLRSQLFNYFYQNEENLAIKEENYEEIDLFHLGAHILKQLDSDKYQFINREAMDVASQRSLLLLLMSETLRLTNQNKLETLKKLQQNQIELNTFKKTLKTLEEKSTKFEEDFSELQGKYSNLLQIHQEKVQTLDSQKEKLIKNNKQQQLQIDRLVTEKERFQRNLSNVQDLLKESRLVSENIDVFLFKKNIVIENTVGPENVHYPDTLERLLDTTSQLNDSFIFIDTDDLSTKDQFRIEQVLRNQSLPFRFVSQGTQAIIRSIITYVEGEFRYETI